MFNRNAIWFGALWGLAIPFVGYALLLTIFEQLDAAGLLNADGFSSSFRSRTLTIVAICLNLVPFNIFHRRRFTESMRGVVLPTFVYVIGWVIYFSNQLL